MGQLALSLSQEGMLTCLPLGKWVAPSPVVPAAPQPLALLAGDKSESLLPHSCPPTSPPTFLMLTFSTYPSRRQFFYGACILSAITLLLQLVQFNWGLIAVKSTSLSYELSSQFRSI